MQVRRRFVLNGCRSIRAGNAGFSLIELMVVIAIMGLLATVVAVSLIPQVGVAKVHKVAADFHSIDDGLQLFKLQMGRYPRTLDELWTAPSNNSGKWQGPYLRDVPPSPRDPWGNEYVYTPPLGSGDYLITSYGEDGQPGGTGDNQDLTNKNIRQIIDGKS